MSMEYIWAAWHSSRGDRSVSHLNLIEKDCSSGFQQKGQQATHTSKHQLMDFGPQSHPTMEVGL